MIRSASPPPPSVRAIASASEQGGNKTLRGFEFRAIPIINEASHFVRTKVENGNEGTSRCCVDVERRNIKQVGIGVVKAIDYS